MKSFRAFLTETGERDRAFKALGDAQRDRPERAMVRLQHAAGGGVMSYAAEHIGDLTHRMSHMAQHGYFGDQEVASKVMRMRGILGNRYGFGREHEENIASNARARGLDPKEHAASVDKHLSDYANAHAKLPVYNKAQWHAREAAVALGQKRYDHSLKHLDSLQDMLDSEKGWAHHASQYERKPDGSPKRFEP